MKKILITLLLSLALSTTAYAASGEVFSLMGDVAGCTVRIATTNASAKLTTVYDAANGCTAVDWNRVRAVTITCDTNDARISVGTAAVNGATPTGHLLKADTSVRWVSRNIINALYIISATDDSAASLQISPEY